MTLFRPVQLNSTMCTGFTLFCAVLLQAEVYDLKVKGEENSMEYRAFFNQASWFLIIVTARNVGYP